MPGVVDVSLGRIAAVADRLPSPLRRVAARLPGALAPPIEPGCPTPRIAVIGSGFGGLGMGARLRQAGIESFTIYEKAHRVGGTWRDNTYPGAACDVPSHLYSLSFAPKPDWSRKFSPQPEILDYLESLVDRFSLRPHIRFGSELEEARFDEGTETWRLRFVDGSEDEADVVVAATGQLNRPSIPPIPGLDDFAGTSFHSARWEHDHDVTGRDVAVIGIGASAIQFVPEVAKTARSVTLFQRSSNFIVPKPDAEFSDRSKSRFRRWPWLQRLYRMSIWLRLDVRWVWFREGSRSAQLLQRRLDRQLSPMAGDGLTAQALVPDYPLGCKRILISNDWYPTLEQPNVTVVTDPVEKVTESAVAAGGQEHPADTIIFGTGFASTGFLAPMRIIGRGCASLHERWKEGAEAHLGMTVSGFPNLFVMYGPNTNLGHNSIIFMLERQMAYVLTCVRRLVEDGVTALDIRPEVEGRYNEEVQRRLGHTVWAASCHSWYKTATGKITNNWPGPSARYWWETAVPRAADFVASSRSSGSGPSDPLARVRPSGGPPGTAAMEEINA